MLTNLFDFQNLVRANDFKDLVFDFRGVPYVDSAGIVALVGAYVTRKIGGRCFCLVAVNGRVRTALQVTRVDQFFSFYKSLIEVEAAVA